MLLSYFFFCIFSMSIMLEKVNEISITIFFYKLIFMNVLFCK